MLFVAPEFLLVFLPVTLVTYWLVERGSLGGRWSMALLLLASIIFYGWSGWETLLLFLGSLALNFRLGHWIARSGGRGPLALGVGLNLALLALFKYTDFGLETLGAATGCSLPRLDWRLPLAISFYTFQQIVYLVQCRKERRVDMPWHEYALAVAFFPHLIAGPLVHYHDLVSQFHSQKRRRVALAHAHEGLNLFIVALAKKLLIADSLSQIATPYFDHVQAGHSLAVGEAWLAAFAYSFQIYFDFSAYSEMAIGLGLMFGIRLPVNFKRPYAAVDLRDFWRRWHITLSAFLRDYVYIPLGGNRKGPLRRWLNLFVTMLLGGLWHGASWNFVAWGGLHGLFLAANHAWASRSPVRLPKRAARLVTFLVVVILWVPFRAETWEATTSLWKSMTGMVSHGASSSPAFPVLSPAQTILPVIAQGRAGDVWKFLAQPANRQWMTICLVGLLVFAFRSNLDQAGSPRARTLGRAIWLGLLLFAIVARSFHSPPGEFIYFRF